MHRTSIRRTLQVFGMLASLAFLAGCSAIRIKQPEPQPAKEASVMSGSSSRNNTTPMESAFACMAKAYNAVKVPVVSITVGDVKDYTGKYSQAEGNAITQGGSLMLYSALGKMGSAVRLQERFDTRIAELGLEFSKAHLKPDGGFLVKVFQGTDYETFLRSMREVFKTVAVRKPDASRDRSAELYLLGRVLR